MAVAILAYFIIVDFPTSKKNKFLSEEEKRFVVARLAQDRGAGDDKAKVTWSVILHTFLDWKIWSFSMMYFAGAGYVHLHILKARSITDVDLVASMPLPSSSQSFFATAWTFLWSCHLCSLLSHLSLPFWSLCQYHGWRIDTTHVECQRSFRACWVLSGSA